MNMQGLTAKTGFTASLSELGPQVLAPLPGDLYPGSTAVLPELATYPVVYIGSIVV